MSFWSNQPLSINRTSVQQILSSDQLLLKIDGDLEQSKLKLDYITHQTFTDELISTALDFINENYVGSEASKLVYSKELLQYFLIDSLLVFFYPKGKTEKLAGLIIGKRKTLQVKNDSYDLVDVNFLCILKKLRNLHLAPYLIGVLTKETVKQLRISLAYYTIGAKINSPCFAKKQMYHRPINIQQLIKGGFFKVPNANYEKIYNDFQSEKIPYYVDYQKTLPTSVVTELTKLINTYSRNTYDIYDNKFLPDILRSKAFYNFVFFENEIPVEFVSFFKIDSYNHKLADSYKNGYLFIVALKTQEPQDLKATFDSIAAYCLKNNLLDVLTLSDIFMNTVYSKINFIPGTGLLNYYFFNMEMVPIDNQKNGLVTI